MDEECQGKYKIADAINFVVTVRFTDEYMGFTRSHRRITAETQSVPVRAADPDEAVDIACGTLDVHPTNYRVVRIASK